VEIEAKLGASLSGDQLRRYVSRLHGRSAEGILVVQMPSGRTDEAASLVRETFGASGTGPWRAAAYPDVAIAVVSWDDVLTALARVDSPRLRGELEQFEAMYKVLSGSVFPPLAGLADLVGWREREGTSSN
jgi:hypothetical protein